MNAMTKADPADFQPALLQVQSRPPSPLGRALIGRQVGDEVEVSTPSGDRYYEIEKIEFV